MDELRRVVEASAVLVRRAACQIDIPTQAPMPHTAGTMCGTKTGGSLEIDLPASMFLRGAAFDLHFVGRAATDPRDGSQRVTWEVSDAVTHVWESRGRSLAITRVHGQFTTVLRSLDAPLADATCSGLRHYTVGLASEATESEVITFIIVARFVEIVSRSIAVDIVAGSPPAPAMVRATLRFGRTTVCSIGGVVRLSGAVRLDARTASDTPLTIVARGPAGESLAVEPATLVIAAGTFETRFTVVVPDGVYGVITVSTTVGGTAVSTTITVFHGTPPFGCPEVIEIPPDWPIRLFRIPWPEPDPYWAVRLNDYADVIGRSSVGAVRLLQPGAVERFQVKGLELTDINARGDIVGTVRSGKKAMPFVLRISGSSAHLEQVETAADADVVLNGLSEDGRAVGYMSTAKGVIAVSVWNGKLLTLDGVPGAASVAVGVNSRGHIAGNTIDANGVPHAFLWRDGSTKLLGPNSNESVVTAISETGVTVGELVAKDGTSHAVAWLPDGVLLDLHNPALASWSRATAVNGAGEIVGVYGTPAALSHASMSARGFRYTAKSGMHDLTAMVKQPDLIVEAALAINASGAVLARCRSKESSPSFDAILFFRQDLP